MKWLDALLHLFYPPQCTACREVLNADEKYICLNCKYLLPHTGFHKRQDNPMEKVFLGRVAIEAASAFLYFEAGGKVQNLLHYIKYKGMKEAAAEVGEWYGEELTDSRLNNIDVIIPVPLHKSKIIKRGYNQSEWFAKGLAKGMNKPIDASSLMKIRKTESQTKKTRLQRQVNVAESFAVKNISALTNKHIMLVDDIITTGATLEACTQTLLALNCGIKISIATIAFAT